MSLNGQTQKKLKVIAGQLLVLHPNQRRAVNGQICFCSSCAAASFRSCAPKKLRSCPFCKCFCSKSLIWHPSRSSARSILTFLHSCNAILHAVMQFLTWSTARTWCSPCFLLTSRVTISCCSDIRGSSSCPTLQGGLRSHVSMPLPYSALQICILSYRSKLFLLQ